MSPAKKFTHDLVNNRPYQFWALNLFGWAGYGFFVSLSAFLWQKNPGFQVFYAVFATLTGLVLSLMMRACYRRFWNFSPIYRGALSLVVVGVASGIWAYFKMVAFMEGLGKSKHISLYEYFGWYSYSFFIILSWAALYFGIKFYQALQEEKQRSLKATSMAHEAQLKMLRYQLNPHFLFNTLNAISTLVLVGESKMANTMVTELSKFLRYSLENDPMQKVDLAQELGALELYLNIEKVRFEDRLRLHFDIEDKARRGLIPSLLLQPLVENSIKYAISKNENGGKISVVAKVFAGELFIEVADDGPGIDVGASGLPTFKGVGLANFRDRLQEIYGDNQSCKFSKAEPSGLKINIRIPYETQLQEKE